MSYFHVGPLRTDVSPEDIRKKYTLYKKSLPLLAEGYLRQHILDPSKTLDNQIRLKKTIDRPGYSIKTSPYFPNVNAISLKNPGGLGHRVVMIKRGDHYEYYDSSGNPIPESLVEHYGTNISSNPHKHQGKTDACTRHAFTRMCLAHMSNDEYNNTISNAMTRYGLSADGVVYGLTNGTINIINTDKLAMQDEPQQSLKHGGIVINYGRRL